MGNEEQEQNKRGSRQVTTVLFTVAILGAVIANEAQAVDSPAIGEAGRFQLLSRGRQFSYSNQRYQHLPDARAIQHVLSGSEGRVLIQVGGKEMDLLVSRQGLLFLQRHVSAGRGVVRSERASGHVLYPVAINLDTGQAGFLPGGIVVRLKESKSAQAIAQDHGLILRRNFEHLGTAVLMGQNGDDVLETALRLAADARVITAEPEVHEAIRQPL